MEYSKLAMEIRIAILESRRDCLLFCLSSFSLSRAFSTVLFEILFFKISVNALVGVFFKTHY